MVWTCGRKHYSEINTTVQQLNNSVVSHNPIKTQKGKGIDRKSLRERLTLALNASTISVFRNIFKIDWNFISERVGRMDRDWVTPFGRLTARKVDVTFFFFLSFLFCVFLCMNKMKKQRTLKRNRSNYIGKNPGCQKKKLQIEFRLQHLC